MRRAVAPQGQLLLGPYHTQPDRTQARLQVIALYAQGWEKRSISRFLQVSRPTIDTWIARWETDHVAGLLDKSRAPKAPARKVWLPLMLRVYHQFAPRVRGSGWIPVCPGPTVPRLCIFMLIMLLCSERRLIHM